MTGAVGMAMPTATASAVTATVRWVMARWRRNGTAYAATRRSSPATSVSGEIKGHLLLQGDGQP